MIKNKNSNLRIDYDMDNQEVIEIKDEKNVYYTTNDNNINLIEELW
jgi:hypothetical protein